MKKIAVRSVQVLAVVLAASLAAYAAPIFIDDFNDSQGPITVNNVTTFAQNGAAAASALGGDRYFSLTRAPGGGTNNDTLDSNVNTPSQLTMSTDQSSNDSTYVKWDGTTGSALNFATMSADLTGGGTDSSLFLRYVSDLAGTITVHVYTDATDYSTWSFTQVGLNIDITNSILFSAMTKTGTGADFTKVTAVDMTIDAITGGQLTRGEDTTVHFLKADSVPEPATMVLLGSGLLGLGIWLRRRKA